mmetsp:Transcript_27710/g.54153  ORF Transcript_27710/g.54153 Transcript_27710/m.54153 type:complete len:281 (+) Transcript_27710:60-902(+)
MGGQERVVVGYWRTRALGQPVRVMLAYMGVPFEDRQYQVGDPPTFDKSVWAEAKPALEKQGLDFPNLPYIIDTDGTAVSQTRTIMRYLARSRPEHKLLGTTPKEETRADLMTEVVFDIWSTFFTMTYSSWLDFASKRDSFFRETLPPQMRRLDRELKVFEWAAGPTLTYSDFLIHEALFQMREFDPDFFQSKEDPEEYKGIRAYMEKFEALPKVAAYVKSDAYLHYPFHNRYSNFVEWKDGKPIPLSQWKEGPRARLHGPPAGRPSLTGEKSFLHTVNYP